KQPFIHLNTIFIASNIILHLFHYLAKPLLTVPNHGDISHIYEGAACGKGFDPLTDVKSCINANFENVDDLAI
ncbi:hypothetical protein, partial [Candidatus Cyrtobacter comes]|uniref:hypothetical protein n=1 Tax=Candidatus Cyrtobacter comes TaxID=675776 RepID=UPI002ACEA20C